ncbi:LrgB family protein [Marinobacteraceae bacterium S3BR75-40.1]
MELTETPLFWLPVTIGAYLAGRWLYRRSGGVSFLQPVLVSIILIVSLLLILEVSYARYFQSVKIIHFLLGTATVALAIPLYDNLGLIRQKARPFILTLLVSGIVASGSAVGLAWWAGADAPLLLSLAPKSITTPFAIGVAERLGGYPALAASFVITTGILVAAFGSPLLRLLGVTHPAAQGCAFGMTGHGIGTARAFELDPQAGAFSALSMSLMGLYTVFGMALLHGWFG